MIASKILTNPQELNEESTFEGSYTSDGEKLFEQEIEDSKEEISGDQNQELNHAYESFIEQWFQTTIMLDPFCFFFYFVKSHFQQLFFHIFVYSRFHFFKIKSKSPFTFGT